MKYTYRPGLPGGIGGLLHLNQGGAHYSYIYDGKGNVTALLDANTNVAATYQYDPFGKPRGPANSLSQPMMFSTKPYDDKTGLSYYGYRFYVPSLGRWLTRDPIGERGGINLYGFVRNNPINYIDLFGLYSPVCETEEEAAKAARDDVLSRNRKWEWGGYITKEDGGYSYTEPRTDRSPTTVNRGPLPDNAAADYHSHTPGKYANEFSPEDMFSNDIGPRPGYLITPNGNLYRYDPVPVSSPNPGPVTPVR